MSVEITQEETTYAVEYKGKEYVVIRTTNTFNGWTDDEILCEGEPVLLEDEKLAEEIVLYLNEALTQFN